MNTTTKPSRDDIKFGIFVLSGCSVPDRRGSDNRLRFIHHGVEIELTEVSREALRTLGVWSTDRCSKV